MNFRHVQASLVCFVVISTLLLAQNATDESYNTERKQAVQLYNSDKHLQALRLFEDLARRNPDDPDVLVGLAACLIDQSAMTQDKDATAKERIRARGLLLRAQQLGDNSTLVQNLLQATAPPIIPFSPELIATLTASTGNTVGRVIMSGDGAGGGAALTLASGPVLPAEQVTESAPTDIPGYCAKLAGTGEHSSALARICEFALSVPKKLPDVMCERETKRYWKTNGESTLFEKASKADFDEQNHADVITAKVTYRDGQEYYEDIHVDGQPADASAPWSSGAWSIGEFALSLSTIFAQSSKPEFRYAKQAKLHSIPAIIFNFHVSEENNKIYFLHSADQIWFPEYHGRIWLDKASFRLIKLERETADMPEHPIVRMKTETDYSNIALGDGTEMVLPTHADVLICPSPRFSFNGGSATRFSSCARNVVKFTKWQKFRATTTIVTNPEN